MFTGILEVYTVFLLLATAVSDLPSSSGSDGNRLCQCSPALSCGRDDAGQIGQKLDGIKSVMERGLGAQTNCSSELANLQSRIQIIERKLQTIDEGRPIKEWVWRNLNLGTDSGSLRGLTFHKRSGTTRLRVAWVGPLRVIGSNPRGKCNRWYFTLNGHECRDPAPIDAAIGEYRGDDTHGPATVDGMCNNVPAGDVQIEFNVGGCNGRAPLGDAYTCYHSTCRIIVEEI